MEYELLSAEEQSRIVIDALRNIGADEFEAALDRIAVEISEPDGEAFLRELETLHLRASVAPALTVMPGDPAGAEPFERKIKALRAYLRKE